MSDLVTDLESTLKGLSSELSESAKVTPDEIREMVMEEAKKLGLNELFGGVTRVKGPRAVRGRRQQATKWEPSKAAMSDAAPKSPGVARAQKLISDWLFLHSTFSPKFRRTMCLGKAGDTLAFELQNLDDMLAKL